MADEGEKPVIPRRGWTASSEAGSKEHSLNLSIGLNAQEMERNMRLMQSISREILETNRTIASMVTSTKDHINEIQRTSDALHASTKNVDDVYKSVQDRQARIAAAAQTTPTGGTAAPPQQAVRVRDSSGQEMMLPAVPQVGQLYDIAPAPPGRGVRSDPTLPSRVDPRQTATPMSFLQGVSRGEGSGILGSAGFAYRFPGAQMAMRGFGQFPSGVRAIGRIGSEGGLATAEGMGALGEGIAGIGTAAAAVGYGIYQGIQGAGELSAKYGALTGQTGVAPALGYEMKARLLALSPFISSQQGQEIVQNTLSAGYTGAQANTVMDYLAKNVHSGMTDIAASLALYQLGVQKAGATTEEMTTQLQTFQQTAASTQGSLAAIQQGFVQNLQGLTTVGASGVSAVAAAGSMAQLGAQAGMGQAYGGYTGPDTSNMAFRFFMSQQYGVPVWQLPAAMSGGNIPGTADATTQGIIGRLLPDFAKMTTAQIENSPQMMWLPQYLQQTGALTDPTILSSPTLLANWIKNMAPGGKFTSKYQAQHQWAGSHVRDLSFLAKPLSGDAAGPNAYLGRLGDYMKGIGIGSGGMLGGGADAGYAGEIAATGRSNPLVESLLRHDQMSQYYLKDQGQKITVEDYLKAHPNTTFDEMKNFKFYSSRTEHPWSLWGSRAKTTVYGTPLSASDILAPAGVSTAEMSAGSAAAAGQQITIGLTPAAAKIIKVVNGPLYGQGQTNSSTTGGGG